MATLALRLGALAGLLGLAAWALRRPLGDIVHVGFNVEEQSHIILAPIVMGVLIFLRRERFAGMQFTSASWVGPALVIGGWFLSAWGYRDAVIIAWHGGAVMVLLGVVISTLGPQLLMRFPAAFCVLFFMLPVPASIRHRIALPMQRMAASVTEWSLDIMGVAVERNGSILTINGEQVAVGEACNGMRMVFALTLVAYAFVFSVQLRPAVRLSLLILSPLIALLCNVIRLIPTSLFFGFGTTEAAEAFHDLAGWVMLPIALGLFFGILKLLEWLEIPVEPLPRLRTT